MFSNEDKIEDTKGVIRSHKSQKSQIDGNTMAKRKRINNDIQNITWKTKDQATQLWLITKGEVGCSGRVNSSCTTCGTRSFSLVIPVIRHK